MARRPHQKTTANLSGQGVGRGDATNSGLACQAEVRGPAQARRLAGQTRPSALPLHAGRIGAGEVVQDRFGGPLAGRVTRQPLGLVGGRSEARRSGGEAQVGEDRPDHRLAPVCRACLRAARKQVGTGRLDDGDDLRCPATARTHDLSAVAQAGGISLIDLADQASSRAQPSGGPVSPEVLA